jgi:hypothetical protein
MKEASGILGPLFPLQKFTGTPLGPSWEELHYPAKHPFDNLGNILCQTSTKNVFRVIWTNNRHKYRKFGFLGSNSYSNKIKRNTATIAWTHVGFSCKVKIKVTAHNEKTPTRIVQ